MQSPLINLLADTGVKDPSLWFPTDASASNQVDGLAYFILWVCAFFLVFNAGLMVFFAIRYRQKSKSGVASGQTHNTALEVTWSVIPAFILAIIFIWGFRGFLVMAEPPSDSYDILVVGKQWSWEFHYPDGHRAKGWKQEGAEDSDPIALHVPADRPVRLTLQSNDVIHSVSIPQLRVKKDVVPGRYNQMWFTANWDDRKSKVHTRTMPDGKGGTVELKYNVYDLFCTEYCGQDHSEMITKVYVYPPRDFEKWLELDAITDPKTPLWQVGRAVWSTQCSSCHSLDGSGTGNYPTWLNLMGSENHGTSTGPVTVDAAYIRESIVNPAAKLAKKPDGSNYPNAMSSFASLDPREIAGVIEFMKTISDNYPEGAGKDQTWGDLNPDGTPRGETEDGAEGGEAGTGGEAAEPETEADPAP